MKDTYRAILHGDRLEWSGGTPDAVYRDRPVAVRVTILEEASSAKDGRGQRMAAALERLADSRALSNLSDPATWEREVRRERPLPGRDG